MPTARTISPLSLSTTTIMDAPSKRPTRRSHPNLHHLSLTPLPPHYPTTSNVSPPATTITTSYLTPHSLPQSPSIISRSSSRTRLHPLTSKSSYALVDLGTSFTPLSASKSSSQLSGLHHRSIGSSKGIKSTDSADWILQTASVLTTNSAESKGQSWLVTRSSSTSLADGPFYSPVDTPYSYTPRRRASGAEADDEFSMSPDSGRHISKPHSRLTSAKNSRRGSRVGLMTPLGPRTPGEMDERQDGFFGDKGPQFVDVEERDEDMEDEVDEGEMRRLIWGRVGGWVDWAVGWMDFRGDVEGWTDEEVKDEERKEESATDGRRRGRWKRDEGDRIVIREIESIGKVYVPPPPVDGGWRDAAWLLGVATKILI